MESKSWDEGFKLLAIWQYSRNGEEMDVNYRVMCNSWLVNWSQPAQVTDEKHNGRRPLALVLAFDVLLGPWELAVIRITGVSAIGNKEIIRTKEKLAGWLFGRIKGAGRCSGMAVSRRCTMCTVLWKAMFVSTVLPSFHMLHCYSMLDLDRFLTHVILVSRITLGQGEYIRGTFWRGREFVTWFWFCLNFNRHPTCGWTPIHVTAVVNLHPTLHDLEKII